MRKKEGTGSQGWVWGGRSRPCLVTLTVKSVSQSSQVNLCFLPCYHLTIEHKERGSRRRSTERFFFLSVSSKTLKKTFSLRSVCCVFLQKKVTMGICCFEKHKENFGMLSSWKKVGLLGSCKHVFLFLFFFWC